MELVIVELLLKVGLVWFLVLVAFLMFLILRLRVSCEVWNFSFSVKDKNSFERELTKIRNCKKPSFSVLRYFLISLIINVTPSIIKIIPAFLNLEKYNPCFFAFFSML